MKNLEFGTLWILFQIPLLFSWYIYVNLFTLNYELLCLLNIQSIEITETIDKIIGVVTKYITF